MDTVNNFESKVVRAKAKAMIVKIKRGTVERPPMPKVPTAGVLPKEKTSAETDEELMVRLISSGLEGNMDEINSLENRVLRGKIKAAIMKEKRKNNGWRTEIRFNKNPSNINDCLYDTASGLHFSSNLGILNSMFDWFTLEWLMNNLEWAVGLLSVGCVILFFFPVLLGWQLKKSDSDKES